MATVKSIAVIGGGPAGVIAAEVFSKNSAKYHKVRVFEKRDSVGGVWNYSANMKQPTYIPFGPDLDHIDPILTPPDVLPARVKSTPIEQWLGSPAYDDLKTNVTNKVMCFSDAPFYPNEPSLKQQQNCISNNNNDFHYDRFVLHSKVKKYLEEYSKPARELGLYVFNTSVEEVQLISINPPKYRLTLRQSTSSHQQKTDYWWSEDFDAIVVASGQFNVPLLPEIPGLPQYWAKHPERCIHSKYFKNNLMYKDSVTVVVGCGVSGNDITLRVAKTARKIYQSKRNPSRWEKIPGYKYPEGVIFKPEIAEILSDGRALFQDGTSTECAPDYFIFATGYQHDYKFLRKNFPGILTEDDKLADVFLGTFSMRYPNMAFIAGERMGSWAAFRAYEYQACAIDGVFSRRTRLPNYDYMMRKNKELEDFLQRVETMPFQSMLIVRKQAVEFAKLAGGFSRDNDNDNDNNKTKKKTTTSKKSSSSSSEQQVNKAPKWTHELDVELLQSSFDYLVECVFEGEYPDQDKINEICRLLSVPMFSPQDDAIYDKQ
ncbi:uncharacterized protein SAPINGB_P003784 [Magnusiomyces paraingens]|uniref:FAD/NAD(P)-binding domain-containing protein n=1 Tax=Magnusiomyces paraingens TaxID=2606893 RepID=A0A5E8BYK6_9ASCO|nr:uncharacterized protein SAPINGB_P003784 [Saprochaete ingens]VVT53855.1 unnamed protein product [Saprochaete ingens]